jgi:hypothetical protein
MLTKWQVDEKPSTKSTIFDILTTNNNIKENGLRLAHRVTGRSRLKALNVVSDLLVNVVNFFSSSLTVGL